LPRPHACERTGVSMPKLFRRQPTSAYG
jgi:hypothetical protein